MSYSTALADQIVALLDTLTPSFTHEAQTYTAQVTGHRWARDGYGTLPVGVVMPPRIRRRDLDEPDPEMGSRGMWFTFPVVLVFDAATPAYAQEQAVATIEALIDAIDGSRPPLDDDSILDAVLVDSGELSLEPDPKPVLVYEAELQLLKLVTDL